MTGWKSKKAMRNIVKTLDTWQASLLMWEGGAISMYGRTSAEDIVSDCTDLMQKYYPGKYTLVWANTKPNEYHLVPQFTDPKHETMWRLSNASSRG